MPEFLYWNKESTYSGIKTVLIVEDDPDIGEMLVEILLAETPYQVKLIQDASTAREIVRTLTPQLVILDYLLPHMDGVACLDALRARKGLERVPAIIMSANLPKRVRERTDVLLVEKPFDLYQFVALVMQVLETE
ncbi:response regulator [Ktedonobacter racemifer]|uniref:Response regulator receiver protein n=1 Tax=Ktedonobacter racemifer DSM 44963 TaxID=485913 RepID=D6U322_KTERA|nr:response regulator [Ktedonobacter racemifer]EFH82927.1 response regulator receiver protein [Ktedonobacter racemifer DSM 44963]